MISTSIFIFKKHVNYSPFLSVSTMFNLFILAENARLTSIDKENVIIPAKMTVVTDMEGII